MNFLAVTRGVRGDLSSFLPGATRAFEVLTNLLAAGTGCIEILLRVALNLGRAAPPCCDFVTELADPVSQLGLIDSRSKLLRGEKALWLDGAGLPVVALGHVENACMRMQLRRDIAINRAGRIML